MLKNIYKTASRGILKFGKTRYSCKQTPTHILNYFAVSLILYFRDLFKPPKIVLREVDIKHGFTILDYGCGPGNYSIAVSELLEGTGVVFALDKHPIAIKSISKKIKKRSIANIETIHSNCKTGLASNSVDVILLYHVFNDLKNPDVVLEELHRILKPSGILSFMEFNVEGISPNITKSGLFQLQKKMDATYIFVKKIINH
ncbi:MAG: class I SAM-dependent methyltransferase [Nitrosopumilus sp.]